MIAKERVSHNLKIYISSTSIDLKDYRSTVISALRKTGASPVCMEDYVAQDKLPVEKCLADVSKSDLYVGIFAWRYGFVPPGYDKSITELEYRKAIECGIPTLIFLAGDSFECPTEYRDTGSDAVLLTALKEELKLSKMVSWFNSPYHLASEVQAALSQYIDQKVTAEHRAETNPLSIALNDVIGAIETPGYYVRHIQTTEELTELWNIDRSAYSDVMLSLDEFYSWWSCFEYGLKAIFLEDAIIGALGIWPLHEEIGANFKAGLLKERELLPMTLDEVSKSGSRHWYASGIVLKNEYRISTRKSPIGALLKIGLNTWLESPYLHFPAEICSIAISPDGQRMLERFSFIKLKDRLSDVDPFPFYVLRAKTKHDLFRIFNKRGL